MKRSITIGKVIPNTYPLELDEPEDREVLGIKGVLVDKNNLEALRGIDRYKDCTFRVEDPFVVVVGEGENPPTLPCLRQGHYVVAKSHMRDKEEVVDKTLYRTLNRVALASQLIILDLFYKWVYLGAVVDYHIGPSFADTTRVVLKVAPATYQQVVLVFENKYGVEGVNKDAELYLFTDASKAIAFIEEYDSLKEYVQPLETLLE